MAFPAAILGILTHPLHSVSVAFQGAKTVLSRRRILGQLGQLDDRMLRDIGISRHDVFSALAEPMFRDPTIGLVNRARESREAGRSTAREKLAVAHLLRSWDEESRAA